MATKSVFMNMQGGDSDDESAQLKQRVTKTQQKKNARKVDVPEQSATGDDKKFFKATQGGGNANFDDLQVVSKKAPRDAQRTGENRGRGGGDRGRGGRGGRGGERGGRGRGGADGFRRPRTAVHTDADGNPVENRERGQRQPFRGKAREEGHPYDRQDGTGKGRRGDKKGGHGKANWGDRDDKVYKKKGEETEEKKDEKAEEPVEEKKEKEPEYVEEVIGYSLDDFLADKTYGDAKQAR